VSDGSDGDGDDDRTERERMRAGERFDPMAPDLVRARERATALTRWFNGEPDPGTRDRVLRELLAAVGEDAHVEPPFRCDYGDGIALGDGCFLNYGCVVLDSAPVSVGDRCLLGPGVHVYTASHPLDAAERATGVETGAPVVVGDDVWLGGRAVVTPGTAVGDRAVVAAGAVVVDDVPPDVLVAGNPARVRREL
jgi:maltose O-acetyltransferase